MPNQYRVCLEFSYLTLQQRLECLPANEDCVTVSDDNYGFAP